MNEQSVSFGVFELDLTSGELRKGGTRVRLQEQPFQVLKALVERPGEVVTREELQQRLWPEDRFVDFEDGLSTAVKKIRRALGDSAANPRFVETLPKRGYRFVAPVAGLAEAVPVSPGRKGRRLLPWVLAGAGAVTLAAIWVLFFSTGAPKGPPSQEPVPFTSYPGLETSPTFSPDGGRVAFQWCREGECDIYVKLVGGESAQLLTDHPGQDTSPAWSPDGNQIAFRRHHDGEWSINLIPAIGGTERALVQGEDIEQGGAHSGAYRGALRWGGPLLAWHPSGNWIAYADTNERNWRIIAISVESREQHQLTDPPPASLGDSCIAFSPDGNELLFCRALQWTRTEIYRMPVTEELEGAGEPRRVPVAQQRMSDWVWMPNGREIVGKPGKLSRLARLDLREGARAASLGIGRGSMSVAYHGATKRLLYSVPQQKLNVWRLQLDELRTVGSPKVVVASTVMDHQCELSPDGSRIAFLSGRSGNSEVWISDADGAEPGQLTHINGAGGVSFPTWSRDGEHIVFGSSFEGNFDLYSIPVRGGQPRRILAHPGLENRGIYSTDSQTLYFSSARHGSDGFECYAMPASGGEQVQLTEGGGINCRQSPDGRYLYYSRATEPGLWRKPIDGGEAEQLAGRLSSQGGFAVWRDGVYYFAPSDSQTVHTLYGLNLETGERRKLVEIETELVRSVSASIDGRRVIWSKADLLGADLMLVEGFE